MRRYRRLLDQRAARRQIAAQHGNSALAVQRLRQAADHLPVQCGRLDQILRNRLPGYGQAAAVQQRLQLFH
ncbi:hypothetical protein D3C85_1762540 [compost metagenome]